MPTQLPRVPSLIPSSFATRAIGREVSITIFTASSLNSGEKLFFGRGKNFTFPDIHPNGWTVRRSRGTSEGPGAVGGAGLAGGRRRARAGVGRGAAAAGAAADAGAAGAAVRAGHPARCAAGAAPAAAGGGGDRGPRG